MRVKPGQTAVTVTPVPRSCTDSASLNIVTHALLAE